ncbi:hypothetical protein GGI17_005494 [Coemansia sp. S146]|nr:hypothetical protein GGI17_005494 [Coemansia sp. S146]
MSQEEPNKHLRRTSPEPHAPQPRAASDGGARVPPESSAAAAPSEPSDTDLPEQLQTPDHPMPPWVQKGATRSPSSVTGQVLRIGGDFGNLARRNTLVVDKTLIYKALINSLDKVICVCLPHRFGKTFNIWIVEEFFNVVTSSDVKSVDGIIDLAAGRKKRFKLFDKSLLYTTEPKFFVLTLKLMRMTGYRQKFSSKSQLLRRAAADC